MKAQATFIYGQYVLKDQQAGLLKRANQLNHRGNKILLELKGT